MAVLQSHDWPGNVRQLRNNVERLLILAGGDAGRGDHRRRCCRRRSARWCRRLPNGSGGEQLIGLPLREAREMFEREYLRRADHPLRRQHLAHRRLHRHGALGAAPQAQVAGRIAGARRREDRRGTMHVARRLCERPLSCRIARRTVHVEDRGFQFADGVYEVCAVQGRAAGRRARHMDRLERCSTSCASRMPMTRASAGARAARDRAPQPRARRHRLSAGHARRRAPRPCVPAARHAAERRGHGARATISTGCEQGGAEGIAVVTRPGHPLGRVRHQDGVAAAQRARQAGGARAGRQGGLVRRREGFVTEGSSTNAWIVDARRQAWSPAGRRRHPARHHPHRRARGDRRAGARSSRSGPSRWTRPTRRARPSSPRRRSSSCRWCGSTASRSANGAPGLIASALAARLSRAR